MYLFYFIFIPANEAPDPGLEQAGILCLQAKELAVEHYVCYFFIFIYKYLYRI